MPHTNSWSDDIPLGSELAKNIDDQIRQLRLDIHERMDDLVVDWEADPVVIQPALAGGTILLIPHASFLSDLNGKENDISAFNITGFCGESNLYAPVQVPNGVTITKLEHNIDRDAASSVTIKLCSIPFSNPPATVSATLNTLTTGSGTLQTMDSGAISILTDTDNTYFLEVSATGTPGNSYKIYGSRITFTFP